MQALQISKQKEKYVKYDMKCTWRTGQVLGGFQVGFARSMALRGLQFKLIIGTPPRGRNKVPVIHQERIGWPTNAKKKCFYLKPNVLGSNARNTTDLST